MKFNYIIKTTLLLLCLLGGVNSAWADTVTAQWSWQNGIPSDIGSMTNFEGITGYLNSDVDGIQLYVDATHGKLTNNGNNAQFNDGTILRVPVISTQDVVTVYGYIGISNYCFDGGETLQNENSYTANTYDVNRGYVEVTSKGGYLYGLKVVQDNTAAATAFKNFAVNMTASWIDNSINTFFVAVAADGTPSIVNNESDATFKWSAVRWNDGQHGWVNPTITVKVDGAVKIGLGNCKYGSQTATITDSENNVTNFQVGTNNCWSSSDVEGTTTYGYYKGTGTTTLTIQLTGYAPYISVEAANPNDLKDEATITFAVGGGEGIEGIAPSAIKDEVGKAITIPANFTLYKEGYTLTGWSDGTTTYAPGASYTITEDITLNAVFTENTVALSDATSDVTVKWDFQRQNGAPTIEWQNRTGDVYVTQATINGSTIDVKFDINTNSGGKFNNVSWNDWCQINGGTTITLPSKSGATVMAYSMNEPKDNSDNKSTLDGNEYVSYASYVATYTATSTTGSSILSITGGSYYRYIELTYPGTGNAWDNFTNFELDLRNGNYIHSDETSNTTIGFKKSGDNIVRTTSDDEDAIGTLTGKYHSNEHGLQNFSMKVAVPGYVKISVGSCAWGGNFTIVGNNGFSKTINTNTGSCYHQNTTNNKVVVYYNVNEGTTLTLSGGNYVPYIAIESVNEVPATHVVRFYNGETLVDSREVYNGTIVGTLPPAPSVESGKHFRGWYTSCDANGVKAKTSTVITANTDFYAYIMDVNKQNGFVVPVTNDGQSLLNAIEYCTENAGDDVQKIYVPNGTYDLGTACRTQVGSNVVILGQSREGVLIQNHPTVSGIQATSVLRLTGDNVYLQNMTLRCDVSYSESSISGVGVVLEINGDRSICNNVELQGNQDTYYSNGSASQVGYFKGGRIEGTVDYICGGGNMWFEGTQLYNNARTNKDVILAPSTAAATDYGYVLNNCTVDGASGQEGFNIARPWQGSPAATLINTTFKQQPSSAGYTSMNSGLVIRFHEYGSKDADGNAITGHNLDACGAAANSDGIYLNETEAAAYSYANVLGGWDPEATIKLYSTDFSSNIANWASFTPAFDCRLSDSDAKAYIITAINENSLTGNTVNVLKAGEGYFIKTPSASQKLSADITYETADDVTGTMLVGCLEDTPLNNTGNTKYFLGVKNNQAGLFYVGSAGITIPAGKCYLQSNTTQARNLSLNFDNETSGISEVTTSVENGVKKYVSNGMLVIEKNGIRYNVNGVKVNE